MRKQMFLVVILVLFLVPAVIPSLSSFVPDRVDDTNFIKENQLSADGDESSESITSFSETLADDVLFYPDPILNDTEHVADNGEDDWADSQVKDGVPTWDVVGPAAPSREKIEFIHPDPNLSVEGFDYAIYTNASFIAYFHVWNGTDWVNYDSLGAFGEWNNGTVWGSVLDGNNITISLLVNMAGYVYCDYLAIKWRYMTLSGSGHFAEGFADISDWTTSDTSITTDDDVATITENGAGSTGRAYDSISSTDFFEYYYEFRIDSMTATTANLEFWDGDSYETLKTFTAAGTYRGIISDTDAATMQRIGFLVGSEGGNVKLDYLRISLSTESGWQHDCSITDGVDDGGGGSSSSNGDLLTLTADSDGSVWNFTIDTTATATALSAVYYPFLHLSLSDHSGDYVRLRTFDGTSWATAIANTTASADMRCNIGAADSTITKLEIALNPSASLKIDFLKAYSIANYTLVEGSTTTDDYLYVTSNILYSTIDSGYIELNNDPALTVNTATYNIFNLTTSGTTPAFAYYVGAWSEYTTETRGEFTSGTLTDLKLNFSASQALSEIVFLTDSTAPNIVDRWVNPNDPDDAEPVTFTAVTYDSYEVYTVVLNAIVYPAGFSDTDYGMTEQEQDKLWSYTFTTMTAGYYLFEITASDGANTDTEYLPVTVIEAGISIKPISFIGAGPDFTGVSFSFDCNRAGALSITEWTAVNETYATDAAETHTGTVIDGLNNIFWTKLTTTSSTVYFNFSITSGSLQENWTSTYQVAQETFDVVLSDKTTTFDHVFLEGESTKAASYAVYDASNILRYTGTIPEGSFVLSFEMWNKRSLTDHAYGIKFTNGSSVDWINGSYYADSPDQYKGGGVATPAVAWWADPMTWVFIGGGLALVYVATSGQKTGNIPNAPKGLK